MGFAEPWRMEIGPQLVQAMLYGKLEGLSEEVVFLYGRTGLLHLFSASGFHMAAALQFGDVAGRALGHWLPQGRAKLVLVFFLNVALMIFFGIATEWSAPMVRAFTFASLLAGAKLLEVRASTWWIFVLSLLCSSLLGSGSKLSFFLSAFGMAGILFLRPKGFWALIFAPWLATMPICVWHFGLVSLSSPLWNFLLGSLLSVSVMPLAILGLLLRPFDFVSRACFRLAAWLMENFHDFLFWGDSHFPAAVWVPFWPWAIACLAIGSAFFLWKRSRMTAIGAASCSLLVLLLPSPVLAMLAVGQGDAIWMRLRSGEHWLVDTGPRGRNDAPVSRELAKLGIGELDHILLTHADLDHRGGLESLLTKFHVSGSLWIPEKMLSHKGSEAVLEAAERAQVPIRFLDEGKMPKGMHCWLAPFSSKNDSSPLCMAELPGEKRILLTGDMSFKSEDWFLFHLHPFPKVDILKVAHHGSKHSSGTLFLQWSGAKEALIGVGRNRYGHPSKDVLERLQQTGMKVHRTDLDGTMLWY